MSWIETLVVIVHVLVAVAVIGLIMIQQGKGADAGAAFGGGASQTVFGSQGGVGFLVKVTGFLALMFFVTSFALAVFAKQKAELVAKEVGVPSVIQQDVPAAVTESAPTKLEGGEGEPKPSTLE